MSLHLEQQMLFYGQHHNNGVNVLIHVVCVPTLLMTGILLGANTPAIPLPSWLSVPNLPLNFGTIGAAVYSTLYILMEPVAGGLVTPLIMGGAAYMNHLVLTYGATANYWAAGIFILSWLAQFVGHEKFEGRAPALLDNVVQALFLAPFFIWFEILFFLGYRPDLKRRIDKAVKEEIRKYREGKGKGLNGTANGKKSS